MLQTHHDMGHNEICLSPDAIGIYNKDRDLHIVAKAPVWKVMIYRLKEKKAYCTDLKGFGDFSVFGPIQWTDRAVSHAILLGKETRLRLGKETENDLHLSRFQTAGDTTIAWTIDDIKVSKEVQEAYRLYYHLPITGVFWQCSASPQSLARSKEKAKGSWLPQAGLNGIENWLTTQSCRQTKYNAADFAYPQDFKIVKTQSEILVSKDRQKAVDELLDGLGVGAPEGPSAAQSASNKKK